MTAARHRGRRSRIIDELRSAGYRFVTVSELLANPLTELLHGLDPIAGEAPQVLILGNMPSAMSLASGQYYGNPRNAFWRITGALFGFSADAPYPERVASLLHPPGRGVGCASVLPPGG